MIHRPQDGFARFRVVLLRICKRDLSAIFPILDQPPRPVKSTSSSAATPKISGNIATAFYSYSLLLDENVEVENARVRNIRSDEEEGLVRRHREMAHYLPGFLSTILTCMKNSLSIGPNRRSSGRRGNRSNNGFGAGRSLVKQLRQPVTPIHGFSYEAIRNAFIGFTTCAFITRPKGAMLSYVLYLRTDEGQVERLPDRVYKCFHCSASAPNPFSCRDDCLHQYVHEEQLIGWPEPKVFWEKKTGSSIGIAPVYEATST